MKRNLWTTAIICSLVASVGAGPVLARGGDGDKGKQNQGGGGPKHGGGGPPKAGGGPPAGAAQNNRGGGHNAGPGQGGAGGAKPGHHAPPVSGGNPGSAAGNIPHKPPGGGAPQKPHGGGSPPQQQGNANPGHAHKPHHNPGQNTPGQPHKPGHQPGHQPGQQPGKPPVVTDGTKVTVPPAGPKTGPGNVVVHPPGGGPNHHHPGGKPDGHHGGPGHQPGGNHNAHKDGPHHPPDRDRHGPRDHHGPNGHPHFVGNTVQFGNRPIHLGNAGYRPSYQHHGGHYHGHWNHHNPPPGYGWGLARHHHHHNYRPYFWGLGGWGLGSLIYGSGYLGYSNPYYAGYSGVGYNYAQPIPVVYNATNVVVDPNGAAANSTDAILNSAIGAFKLNDYNAALDLVNQGISQHPDDAVLHEFRGLVLFAKGDYQQAAATIHSVLAVGPGWDWPTMSGMYGDVNLYTTQLRQLEAVVKQNPMDAATRFLLAYHYLSDGYPDAAVRQLQQVVVLMPNDQVAASLLKMSAAPQETPSNANANDPTPLPVPQPPTDLPSPSETIPTPIDLSTIMGVWKARRDDGSSFDLTLTNDSKFTWGFAPKDQPMQSFSGTYSLEGNVIALEREGGGSLVAEISSNDGSKFNFKMVGAPETDPGLNFVK